MKQYVQTDLEADRQVANTLARLIIGGALPSTEVMGEADEDAADDAGGMRERRRDQGQHRASLANPLASGMQKAPSVIGRGL